MTQIYANNFITLLLGRRGENLARKVVFDIRDLESLYGTGDVEVIYQRPGDAQPYPLTVQREGTLVTWDVTSTDTEMSDGSGKCELRYYAGETLAKSKTWRTLVEPAMDTPSETTPPEPEQGWVDQIIAVGAAAKASEGNAAGSASAAADSATAAQTAQIGAEAAQSAAEQSAQEAAESAAVYDTVVADVTQLKQDIAAITPDDTTVDGKPWTSKKIVDSLCMPFEESGNPVQCYPVENYPLGVKVSWEPTQEGSGDPSPDNIRPITGWDSVTITHSNDVVSNDYNIALPETVYGGTLDLETGVVTVSKRITIADGTVNKFKQDTSGQFWNMNRNSAPGIGNVTKVKNSHFIGRKFGGNKNYSFIYTTPTFMKGLFNTADDLNAYLVEQNTAGAPVTFVYELQNPYTIQLTPQQITALSGVNTIYTDADGVVVTGAEDPKHTITELKNAIISLGGNV